MSIVQGMTAQERRELKAYQELLKRISTATAAPVNESVAEKEKRVTRLKARPEEFMRYYFPHYMDSDFGWFQKKALLKIKDDPNLFLVAEWAREHAKSVLFDVMVPLWLLACGELTGMILASSTEVKAKGLLKDIQAELVANKRFVSDYGEQKPVGGWRDGAFSTMGGIGFWAFGIGQNPAGVREAEKRPNYGVVDDADDKKKAKNQKRVKDDEDWVLGEFFGCLSIRGARKVYANNRVHREGLTAHIVGDVKPEDGVRKGIVHIKVFATEDPKTHKMLMPESGGVPSWPERYTLKQITDRIDQIGRRNALRQFYHHHVEQGLIFTDELLDHWITAQPLRNYDALISYCDPSWKGTKKSDFKAIVLVGKKGKNYDILWAWVRQASPSLMVEAHYQLADRVGDHACQHWIEGGLMQDQHMENYKAKATETGDQLRIREDKRKKPDKTDRIADLEPLMNLGNIRWNEAERKNPDMIRLREQFLGFPYEKDDGPDACEGAIHLLSKKTRTTNADRRTGNYTHSRARG